MLRILLADDHDIVRRGLKDLGTTCGLAGCAEAANGREAVELALQHRPHVAVIDLSMPELNGLEATRRIRQSLPDTEVLIFTMHESEELIREVLGAGARGYLLKSDAVRQLIPAVESLSQKSPTSPDVCRKVLDGFPQGGQVALEGPTAERLTSREREVVQLLAEGKSNKQIARLLDLSVKTVETHRTAAMRKLELNSCPTWFAMPSGCRSSKPEHMPQRTGIAMPPSTSTSFLLNSLERPARALVIGASGGIGSAVTDLLASEGFETVHALSRSGADQSLAGVRVGRIDLENEASIAAAAARLVEGALRFVLVATGLLHDSALQPEKTYRTLDPEHLLRSFRINAIGPALVAKHVLPLMPKAGKASLRSSLRASAASRTTASGVGTATGRRRQP